MNTEPNAADRRAAHRAREAARRRANAIAKGHGIANAVKLVMDEKIASIVHSGLFAVRLVEVQEGEALALLVKMTHSSDEAIVFFAMLHELTSVNATVEQFEAVLGSSILMLGAIVRDMQAFGMVEALPPRADAEAETRAAYEAAVAAGFVGTQEQWLNSQRTTTYAAPGAPKPYDVRYHDETSSDALFGVKGV